MFYSKQHISVYIFDFACDTLVLAYLTLTSEMANTQELPTAYLFGDIFIYNSAEKESECILKKENKKCGVKLSTNRPYNLKRHVELVHRDFVANIVVNKCEHNLSANYILNCCVEIITINGRPLASLSDSGFLKLMKPLLDSTEQKSGQRFCIGLKKVKSQMQSIAEQIRDQIINETKNTLISVLIDIATKCGRAFLGVNIQYMLNGRIVVRTLKMLHLTESHTGKSLANAVVNTLKEFDISINQVYSQTTDNAANVLLSSKLLDKLAEAEKQCAHENENEMTIEEIEEQFYMELLKEAEREFFQSPNVVNNVVKLHCGEHTFQLAFNDALDESTESNELMKKVKAIAKKLRTPNVLNTLKSRQLKFPLLANDTRWTGKYKMVTDIIFINEYLLSIC